MNKYLLAFLALFCSFHICAQIKKSNGNATDHEYVDLGLPSGTLWATCNVGANSPEEYGDYFSWGGTEPKSDYSACFTCGKSTSDLQGSGIIDANNNLTKNYDAAMKNWGGSWRMPTLDEIKELLNEENCSWEWKEHNGVYGRLVTSKKNDNSVFLPAAGWRIGTELYDTNFNGCYWSSTVEDISVAAFAYELSFSARHCSWGAPVRYEGFSVRPVYNKYSETALIEFIGFETEKYKICKGQTLKLNPQISPTNATNKTLTWKSGNHSVATVDEQGNVTAIAPGTATILIQTTDGSHKWAWCEIDVVERLDAVPVEWLTIVNESGIEDLHTGETLQLGVELYPLGTTAEVLWESSNPDVATVDQNGLVTAVAVGVRKEMASIKAKVIGPGNPTSTRWITVSPVIPDVAQGAYLLQVEGFSHAHDLEPVQAITADGRSRMLITMDFPEYVEPEVKPILRAYNANGELLTLPEDEMGTITAMTEVKGKKGFIYKAPVNTNSVAMSNMGFYDIEVLYPLRYMDEYVSLVKFPLFRPGVLLVHGLLSDPSCFTKDDQGNNGLYEFLQDKNYGFVALVDYEDSHASAFEENSDVLNVVGNHCNAFYEELFRIGLLSSAYDFVGHSMGGILSRFYVQNHNRDAAHKIITLNTPHWGSKIANLGLLADEWYSPLNAAMETWGKAISDLGVDSEPILKLSETASQTIGIPVHAMCSYIDDYDKVYELEVENKGSLSKYLKDYLSAFGKVAVDVSGNIADYKWWDFWTFVYGEPRWDFWVGYTSQKSGLADDYVTVFHEPATSINLETSRAHHVNCHHWEPYMFGTLNALKARVDNGHFSKYGYEPISDKYRLNTWRNDSYSNAKKRAPKAKVADGSGIQIEAVLSYEDGEHRVKISLVHEEPLVANHVYALLDESSCLSAINRDEYEFAIPNNYSGPITFNVVGKTQNDEVATASVTVDVPNMGVIEDISFSAMSNTMIEGQEKFFHVKGVWANGNYRNVEADLSSSNTDVAVIENGIVKAVAPGTFTLTAKYNGMSTSMDVNVYKKVAADESDAITSVIAKTNGEEQIYSVSGIKQSQLQNGVNIIRKADGKTIKVF